MGYRNSFADRVRSVYRAAGGEAVVNAEACLALDLVSDADKRPFYAAQRDLAKAGELVRVRPGAYRYVRPHGKKPEAKEVMWRILRARRSVSIDDLVELAGVARTYAEEWLYALQRREIVRRTPSSSRQGLTSPGQGAGKYLLISDTVEMPAMTDNADKMAALRARTKQDAIEALDRAWVAISEARRAVAGIAEGEKERGKEGKRERGREGGRR